MTKDTNKRLLALLLAFTMVANMAVPAYASSVTSEELAVEEVKDEIEVADQEEGYYEYSGVVSTDPTEEFTDLEEEVVEFDEDGGVVNDTFVSDGIISSVEVEDYVAPEEECAHDYMCGHLSMSMEEAAEAMTAKGTITSTLRFDTPTSSAELLSRNITVSLWKDDQVLGTAKVIEGVASMGGMDVKITTTNGDGNTAIAGDSVFWCTIEMTGVPAGEYNLQFSGDNFKNYFSEDLDITDYSKHIVVGTADDTFTYGDVTGDDKINVSDLDALKANIMSDENNLDLNNDGVVDIVDLATVQLNIGATGDALLYSTSMVGVANKITSSAIIESVEVTSGELLNIFESGNEEEVQLTSLEGGVVSQSNPVEIPIVFEEAMGMSEIQITTPSGNGSIQSGTVEVIYEEDGVEGTMNVPFSVFDTASMSRGMMDEGISLVSDVKSSDSNTIVISLGTRVAVKVITVKVEAVESEDGTGVEYVAVQEVTFIEDIVPEDPSASNAIIENIKVTESNKSLSITWDKCNNVGGYRVRYGTSASSMPYSATSSTNAVTISGLENLTEYFFVVEATSGSWTGTPSEVHSGTPQPSSKPGTPKDISVTPWDESLKLTWTAGLDTETFNIYLKKTEEADSEYVQVVTELANPAYNITGLENGVSYTFKISGTNCLGEGSPCSPIQATPEPLVVDPPLIPSQDRIPSSNVIGVRMQDSSNIDTSNSTKSFTPAYVTDDDFDTVWVASTYNKTAGFYVTFEEAHDMSYLIWTTRLDGNYPGNIANYSVTTWEEDENGEVSSTGKSVASGATASLRYDENGTSYYVMPFTKTENVKQIYVVVSEKTGAGRVSASELTFYEHNSIEQEITALFTDDSFTAIKSTVTASTITKLQERLDELEDYVVNKEVLGDELRFASDLLNGEDGFGYVKDDFVQIDNSKDDRALSGISPLGVVGLARTDLAIYADIPAGGTLTITPSQYFNTPGSFTGTSINLVSGRNIVRVEDLTNISGAIEGGVYYYKYTGPNVEDVKIHVLNYTGVYKGINTVKEVIAVPTLELYDLGLIEDADQTEVRKRLTEYVEAFDAYTGKSISDGSLNPVNSTEISTRSVLLSVPASGVWSALGGDSTSTSQKVDTLMNTILAWDEIIYITHTMYGDEPGERQGRQNVRYMRMSANAFMYAAGNHIGIQFGSTGSVINASPTPEGNDGKANSLHGWGIAHEIGHNMDRVGVVEITNNIYASMVTAWDGNMALNTGRVDYASAFAKVAVGGPGVPNGFFVQLGMYWQLHLAYANEDPLEFYTGFNKEWKAGTYSNLSGNNRVAAIASKVAKKDLTEYFTQWGVVLSDTALGYMSQYEVEDRKIQYIDDAARVYRLTSGRSGITGDVDYSITGAFDPVNYKNYNLVVNHEMDTQDLQGFEVYRDDVRIAFITKNSLGNFTYSDTIGSLNNVAFQYSVQAVDKLGNLVGERAYGDQVRIEYDNVVDSSAYTMEAVEGGYKYTFKEATTTSGIIINDAPETGNFEVTIASYGELDYDAESGESTYGMTEHVTAKTGDYSKNETLSGNKFKNYYHKAGAESDNTTIGVYDALEIIITGDIVGENVQFLAGVDDNVVFTDYMVGRLGHDYDTGAGVLNEGDIIIIGEYLGDPYFNEIVLNGKYGVSSTDEVNVEYVERAMAGSTYMFATVPENGMVSVITDGLFIFKPDVQNESILQGVEEGVTCGGVSLLPAEMQAVMNRTSDTGTRQTSATMWQITPTDETLPTIILN